MVIFVHVTKQHVGVVYKILYFEGFLVQKGCTTKKKIPPELKVTESQNMVHAKIFVFVRPSDTKNCTHSAIFFYQPIQLNNTVGINGTPYTPI